MLVLIVQCVRSINCTCFAVKRWRLISWAQLVPPPPQYFTETTAKIQTRASGTQSSIEIIEDCIFHYWYYPFKVRLVLTKSPTFILLSSQVGSLELIKSYSTKFI